MKNGPVPEELLEELAMQELKYSTREKEKFNLGSSPSMADQFDWETQKLIEADPIRELIRSMAKEEAAIAHLIHAEVNQIKAFTGQSSHFPTPLMNEQISDFQNALARVLEALVEKQKLLIKTLELSERLLKQEGNKHG